MPLSYASALPEPTPVIIPTREAPPLAYEDVREELASYLERTAQGGQDLCQLLGMTSTWNTTRWVRGSSPEVLLPSFRITVSGNVPDDETTEIIVRRLREHLWNGALLSREPIFRIDAHRETASMSLTAANNTVRLVLHETPVRLNRTLATWILAGAFEDEDEAH